ncbi:retrotransposon protein, partial [Striga asiatica]
MEPKEAGASSGDVGADELGSRNSNYQSKELNLIVVHAQGGDKTNSLIDSMVQEIPPKPLEGRPSCQTESSALQEENNLLNVHLVKKSADETRALATQEEQTMEITMEHTETMPVQSSSKWKRLKGKESNKSANMKILQIIKHDFCFEVEVAGHAGLNSTWYIFVYASTSKRIREEQWAILENARLHWGDSWVLGGDWNEVLDPTEKKGGRRKKTVRDGKSTKIWQDPWIPNTPTGIPTHNTSTTSNLTWVCDLLEENGTSWNENLLAA